MGKEFKGVIKDWALFGNKVHGMCVLHTTYEDGISRDAPITTSAVVQIGKKTGGFRVCETRNSQYILVD